MPNVYCWSSESLRRKPHSMTPVHCNAESMVWMRPGDDPIETAHALRAKQDGYRCLFLRHVDRHAASSSSAWSGSRTKRLIGGPEWNACIDQYDHWQGVWSILDQEDAVPDAVVVEYESMGGIGYWQLTNALGIDETVDLLRSVRLAKGLDWIEGVEFKGGPTHDTYTAEGVQQYVAELVASWLRETVARPFEEIFGRPCPISNYQDAGTAYRDRLGNLHPVASIAGISSPRLYLDPGRNTRKEYAAGLIELMEADPLPLRPWLSPGFRGDAQRYELPDDIDADLVTAACVRSVETGQDVLLWTGDAHRARTTGGDVAAAVKRQQAACDLVCETLAAVTDEQAGTQAKDQIVSASGAPLKEAE